MTGVPDLRRAAAAVFVTRLAEIVLVAAVMAAMCWGLYGNGPGIAAILLVVGLGALVQVPAMAAGTGNKVSALLWEELRTGGIIAAVCAGVGVLVLVTLNAPYGIGYWRHVEFEIMAVAVGVPLVTALLLILTTANSGHLAGGFLRRILRLPVGTGAAVVVALTTRLIEVMAVATAMMSLCWVLYGRGPGVKTVLLIGVIYLFIQVLDWMRAVAALLVPLVIGFVLWALLRHVGGIDDWGGALVTKESASVGLAVFFGLSVAAAYGLSLALVRMARHGERLALFSLPAFDIAPVIPWRKRRKPFTSPLAAQTWFEMRRSGLLMPAMLGVFWLLPNGVRWLILYSQASDEGGNVQAADLLIPSWLFEISPFIALPLAAAAWGLRASLGARKSRPAMFMARQPITKAHMAQAHLIAAGVAVALSVGIVGIVSTCSFLFSHDGHIAAILFEALAHGETTYREIAAMLAGPPLLAALVAWVIMGLSNRLGGWLFAVAVLSGLVLGPVGSAVLTEDSFEMLEMVLLCFVMLLPVLLLAGGLVTAATKNLMSRRSLIACVLLWLLLALGAFPFTLAHPGQNISVLSLACLTLSALVVLPYATSTLVLSARDRWQLVCESPGQHRRGNRVAGLATLAIVVLLGALAWLRWPSEPAWKAAWRAEGKPTNLGELDAWYEHVPHEENLANRYLKASRTETQLGLRFFEQARAESHPELANGDANAPRDPQDYILVMGYDFPEDWLTEPIPAEVWKWTRRYWEAVGSKVAADLHAAANSGLTQARYPANLHDGYNVRLEYLSRLRQLARILAVEAWVACIERRPDDAINAALDTFAIGHPLKGEPVLVSQLVRIAICGIACGNAELVVSRMPLTGEELARLQQGLVQALPTPEEGSMMDRAMVGEGVMVLQSLTGSPMAAWDAVGRPSGLQLFVDDVTKPLRSLLGFPLLDRILTVRFFNEAHEWSQEYVETGRAPLPDRLDRLLDNVPLFRAPTANILLPALGRVYESEWRVRTQVDAARTAIAVERFRLAHGRLPEALDQLAPDFLERIPRDPHNEGKPLSYRVKGDGSFIVYGFGRNRRDDKGKREYRKGLDDIVFTLAPPAVRNRPQVRPEPDSHKPLRAPRVDKPTNQ